MKNERTSKRVAAIAGRILRHFAEPGNIDCDDSGIAMVMNSSRSTYIAPIENVTVADLKALAASALTQSPEKPKRKTR